MPSPGIDPILGNTAMALGDMGYDEGQIARQTGLGRASIHDIVNRHGRWGEIAEKPVFQAWRLEQQKILEASARSLASQAAEQCEKAMPKASALQAATVFAIMVDKSRLLAGESTQNIEVHNHVEIEALDKLASALSLALMPTGGNNGGK